VFQLEMAQSNASDLGESAEDNFDERLGEMRG
jgi:hypothetical protein